jgi:hypothetical protein
MASLARTCELHAWANRPDFRKTRSTAREAFDSVPVQSAFEKVRKLDQEFPETRTLTRKLKRSYVKAVWAIDRVQALHRRPAAHTICPSGDHSRERRPSRTGRHRGSRRTVASRDGPDDPAPDLVLSHWRGAR